MMAIYHSGLVYGFLYTSVPQKPLLRIQTILRWILRPKIKKFEILFCHFSFFLSLIQEFFSKIIIYKNRILPYYTQLTKKSSLRKFRYDFLIILVDVLFFKDPDPVFFHIRRTMGIVILVETLPQ